MHNMITFSLFLLGVNQNLITLKIPPKNLMSNNQIKFKKKIVSIWEFKVLW